MPAIADGVRMTVDVSDLLRKLAQLGVKVKANTVRRGLYAGAAILRDEARRHVPIRTGALKKSIIAETDRHGSTREKLVVKVKIAPNAFKITPKGRLKKVSRKSQKARGKNYVRGEVYPRNYAHLVEFGTQPHTVGRGSKVEKSQYGLQHPGAKKHPFMRPALDIAGTDARRAAEKAIVQDVMKQVPKPSRQLRRLANEY